MLSVSPCVASAAEPWIQLPLLMMRDPHAARSIYGSHVAASAIDEFIESLPDGEKCFDRAVGVFGRQLYSAAADDAPFFLDKTPRYYLILEDLMRIFPDGKFILLVRNPLAVLASIGKTFYKGRFCWFDFWVDWQLGHEKMANAVQTIQGQDNVMVVRYEELVREPEQQISRLASWLGIPFSEDMVSKYREVQWSGKMGDPIGISTYQSVSTESTHGWQAFFASAFRKSIAFKMLAKIGSVRLSILGYPIDELRADLMGISNNARFDVRGRAEYLANTVCALIDYRCLKLRWIGKRQSRPYTCGRLHDV